MFIKGVSIYFTFFVVSLSGFGARIMLTSYNDFRNFPQVGMLSVGSMGKEPSTGTMAVVLPALTPEPQFLPVCLWRPMTRVSLSLSKVGVCK